jgi:hypothetical protein
VHKQPEVLEQAEVWKLDAFLNAPVSAQGSGSGGKVYIQRNQNISMGVTINIGDREFAFVSASAVIVLLLLGMAGAYNDPPGSGNPAVMGHSVDEIDWSHPIPSDVSVTGDVVASGTVCDANGCIGGGAAAGDITGVTAGTGLTGGGTTGDVTLNADTNYLQRRISNSCPPGESITSISSTGVATCSPNVVNTVAVCVNRGLCSCDSGTQVSRVATYGSCTATSDTGSCNANGCYTCTPQYQSSCCVCAP